MHWLAVSELSIPAGDAWLSDTERARQATMRFTKRRTEYRLRRYAGKRAVSALLDRPLGLTDLAAVELLNRPGGAPYVRLDGSDADFDVSLTDRAGWAIGLVGQAGSMAGSLGVDLEIVEDRSPGFVADYFTPAEQAYIHSCGAHGSEGYAVAANLLWSAKESALKVLRVGLRADTRSVEVTLTPTPDSDGWAPMHVAGSAGPAGPARPQGLGFPGWWRRDGVFLLTLAFRTAASPPRLLAGGDDIAHGIPMHSWLTQPLAPGAATT